MTTNGHNNNPHLTAWRPGRAMRLLALLQIAMLLAGTAFQSCADKAADTLDLTIDPENTPTMLTHDVSTLISDSGITRYHISAPIWYVFGEAREPKWQFPQGLFLEKFDNFLKREATVQADSATYFERRRIWRLDGNVRIKNEQNEKFLTQQLFWDQRLQKIYSDSFIHIERQDRVIEGYGFTSNDRLTVYEVEKVSGIFPVDQFTQRQHHDDDEHATQPTGPNANLPQPRIVGHEGVDENTTVAPVGARTDSLGVAHRHAVDLRARRRRAAAADSLKKTNPN